MAARWRRSATSRTACSARPGTRSPSCTTRHRPPAASSPNTLLVSGEGVCCADFGGATVAADARPAGPRPVPAPGRDRRRRRASERALRGGRRARSGPTSARRAAAVPADGGLRGGPARGDEGRRHRRRRPAQAAPPRPSGVEQPMLARLRRITLGTVVQLALLVLAGRRVLAASATSTSTSCAATSRTPAGDGSRPASLIVQTTAAAAGRTPPARPSPPAAVRARLRDAARDRVHQRRAALGLARMAVNIRFFQRQGVSPPRRRSRRALIDSLAGNVVQALLLRPAAGVLALQRRPRPGRPSADCGGNPS